MKNVQDASSFFVFKIYIKRISDNKKMLEKGFIEKHFSLVKRKKNKGENVKGKFTNGSYVVQQLLQEKKKKIRSAVLFSCKIIIKFLNEGGVL